VVIVFWIVGYLWKRTGWLKLDQIDVDTGRREVDWERIKGYEAYVATQSMLKMLLLAVF
jgi:amino acid transporter